MVCRTPCTCVTMEISLLALNLRTTDLEVQNVHNSTWSQDGKKVLRCKKTSYEKLWCMGINAKTVTRKIELKSLEQ